MHTRRRLFYACSFSERVCRNVFSRQLTPQRAGQGVFKKTREKQGEIFRCVIEKVFMTCSSKTKRPYIQQRIQPKLALYTCALQIKNKNTGVVFDRRHKDDNWEISERTVSWIQISFAAPASLVAMFACSLVAKAVSAREIKQGVRTY